MLRRAYYAVAVTALHAVRRLSSGQEYSRGNLRVAEVTLLRLNLNLIK